MITDYLCLFLGLYPISVCLVPVIFFCGVNCQSFFPLLIKGEIICCFGLECSWGGSSVFREHACAACGFSQLWVEKGMQHGNIAN